MTDYAESCALLTDPAAVVPPVPLGRPGSVRWLRASVARFSTPAEHGRRRALVLDELSGLDVDTLRRNAFESTRAVMGGQPVDVETVARPVPVGVLARALGLPDVAADVAVVARVYHPHVEPDEAAEQALARLIDALGGVADERTAARIGLLIQACEATAGLIANAFSAPLSGKSVAEALISVVREDPPVKATRRLVRGEIVVVDLTGVTLAEDLAFGAGPKVCPGRAHALALAAGVVEALRPSAG